MLKTLSGWAMPSFGSVYLGVGARAMAEARREVKNRGKDSSPQVQDTFAEIAPAIPLNETGHESRPQEPAPEGVLAGREA